jgi:3-phenylpropionate/cinnamic acid dioxygenase small subunit
MTMSDSAVQISNLLYRYAELIDSGDLVATAELFRHARVKSGGEMKDAEGLLEVWRSFVRIYPCGTPRTKHLVTNPIIEIDEAAGTATARSYYTVLQATPELPLQAVAAGRYHDAFERVDGKWRFSYRDYSLFDLQGDLSQHLHMLPVIP